MFVYNKEVCPQILSTAKYDRNQYRSYSDYKQCIFW